MNSTQISTVTVLSMCSALLTHLKHMVMSSTWKPETEKHAKLFRDVSKTIENTSVSRGMNTLFAPKEYANECVVIGMLVRCIALPLELAQPQVLRAT